jgi:hypothetical protein
VSALGQKRTFALRNAMSALSPESGHLEGRMVTMALVKTELEPSHLQRNADDFAVVRSIAESGSDGPVLMLNMNRYSLDSGFPDRGVYQQYISGLGNFLGRRRCQIALAISGSGAGSRRSEDPRDHRLLVSGAQNISRSLQGAGRCGKLPSEGSLRGTCCYSSMSRRPTAVCAKRNRRRSSEQINDPE